jgi:HEPN domain-containing protein
MREETQKWIEKANKDLGNAGFALQSVDGPLPVTTALHCQLSAEKYLKAFLSEHAISFSHQQTLIFLFDLCMPVDHSFENVWQDIKNLNGYSIASRYPVSNHSLAFRESAIASAKRVRDFVLDKLT